MFVKPEIILSSFKMEKEKISHADLFNNPKYAWFRDKWMAGTFGTMFDKHIKPCQIEIEDSNQQMFYVLNKLRKVICVTI